MTRDPRRASHRFRRDRWAAAPTLDLLIGGFMFIGVMTATFLVAVQVQPTTDAKDASTVQTQAVSVGDLLLGTTGVGWFPPGSECDGLTEARDLFNAEGVSRFGLASEACQANPLDGQGNLSYLKITNLQRAAHSADGSNGYLDYQEARAALGLSERGLDFHIRSQPVLDSVRTLLESSYLDPNIRALYIGDYELSSGLGGPGGSDLMVDAGSTDTGDGMILWVEITNNGVGPTVFEVAMTGHLSDRDVQLVQHTPVMASAETVTVSAYVPRVLGWQWASDQVDYIVSDPERVLDSGVIDASGIEMSQAGGDRFFELHAGDMQYVLAGQPVNPKLYFNAFDETGSEISHSDWRIDVFDELGLLVASDSNLNQRGWESFALGAPGNYDVQLKTQAGALLARETVVVVNVLLNGWLPPGGSSEWEPQASVPIESAFVGALLSQYDGQVFAPEYQSPTINYGASGDIYPDVKAVMNNQLRDALVDDMGTPSPNDDEATLEEYTVVVVGSNVDHQVMTSQAAKGAIRDWVFAGGLLIVFGSNDQAVQWLQPIFHSSIASASGGIATPDLNHPVLNRPNELNHDSFDSHGLAWDFNRAEDAEHFTYVKVQGEDALLALSDHGEFGEGRVMLSAYQPFDLFSGPEPLACTPGGLTAGCDGLQLTHNLMSQAYSGLFIDYGPPIPIDRTQGVNNRILTVYHPELQREVAMHVTVWVF